MKTQVEGNYIVAFPEDRINSDNARQIEQELNDVLEQNPGKELAIYAQDLDYVSSAGLRVLLSAQKIMNKQGSMTITNVSSEIMEIFDVTGFCDILTIKYE